MHIQGNVNLFLRQEKSVIGQFGQIWEDFGTIFSVLEG